MESLIHADRYWRGCVILRQAVASHDPRQVRSRLKAHRCKQDTLVALKLTLSNVCIIQVFAERGWSVDGFVTRGARAHKPHVPH